jgi:hypothetical protein
MTLLFNGRGAYKIRVVRRNMYKKSLGNFLPVVVLGVEPTIDCSSATDGEDAVRGLRSGRITNRILKFLDFNMPRLNGVQH